MSGAQTSTFGDPNILYKSLSGLGTAEVQSRQNELMQQQQDISGHRIEMGARLASTLLDPTLYPTTEARAAAYPSIIARARSEYPGYFDNAPATYPGDEPTRALARMGTPSQTQQEWGFNLAANKAYTNATNPPAAAAPASSGAPAQPVVPSYGGGPGNLSVPQEYMPYFQEASQRTGIPVDLLIAQARQESGFNPGATGGAGEVGIMQIHPKTAGSPGFGLTGVQNPDVLRDPRANINFGADYLAARAKAINADLTTPEGQAAALRAYNGGGDPNYAANVFRYMPPSGGGSGTGRPGMVAVGDSLGVGVGKAGRMPTYATERAQPSAIAARINSDEFPALNGQDVVLSTGASNNPKDLASVEQQIRNLQGKGAGRITVLGVGDRPDLAGVNDKLAALAKAYGADFRPVDPATLSADRVHPANYSALVPPTAVRGGAAAPPGAPPSDGRYLVASNAPTSPPGSTAPASGQPQPQAQIPQPPANRAMPGSPDGPPAPAPQPAAPAGGPQPPQLAPLNARGLTPPQQAAIDAMTADPRVTVQQRIEREQAFQNQNIQLQQKAFSDWIQVQQLQTSQGQLSVAQQNSALEYWKAANPEAKVTLTGGEIITQNPRTGEEIRPRIKVTPNEAPRTVEGPGVWDGQKWVQAKPGEQGTPGRWTIGPGGGQFFPSQEAIVEEQKHDAARLAELRKDTFAQAQGAAQTSALIGNAEQAMAAAMKGNIPPGRFGPELLGITAAAKSLGIDLSPFGVDEKALAAGQVTREQLQQMNGAILRKMFPQRVTNVDLATTGAALPNYGLDPEALAANFKIYKAQADYDQARARDMLDYEAQHGGSLVGWEHQWVQKHGFSNGPLDNLFSDAKAGNLSKGATTTSSQPQYREGQTASGKDGQKLIFRNGNWVPM